MEGQRDLTTRGGVTDGGRAQGGARRALGSPGGGVLPGGDTESWACALGG